MKKKKREAKKYIELSLIIFGTLFSIIFWETPVSYPIKIFVVLLHEFHHAIAAFLTGGIAKGININLDLSAITEIKGGNLIIIASAGYIGSLFTGALIYLSSEKQKFSKIVNTTLSVIILIFTINLVSGGLQKFLGVLISIVFFVLPRFSKEEISSWILKFIGLTSCFYVVTDIKQDLLTLTLRETDTQILEYLTGIPALAIGFFWFVIALLTVYFLIKKSLQV
ncbi:MAG: hypothetical protein CR986_07595 [Ignavibacteriae bacterium]|nr:MAG: hypothetical protein CR986_07595 [Ignavibacteriota bacterium]